MKNLLLQALLVAVCLGAASSAAISVDAGSHTLGIEVGARQVSIYNGNDGDAQHHGIAIARREADSQGSHAAQLQQHARAASQDGAMPYFVGSWNGVRNNWYGDVGIAFVPQKDFKIVSLGRHHHPDGLKNTVPVTLWSVETELPLAIVNIGPKATLEGHYHWQPIDEPGVTVHQGREYRLTQACTPNMADRWFDKILSFEEIEANAATGQARFVGAVNQSGFGFPTFTNGQFRRAGMVNFKIKAVSEQDRNPDGTTIESGARRHSGIQVAVLTLSFACILCRVAALF